MVHIFSIHGCISVSQLGPILNWLMVHIFSIHGRISNQIDRSDQYCMKMWHFLPTRSKSQQPSERSLSIII